MAFVIVTKSWLQLYSRFIRTRNFNHVFQQYNARCHISRVTMSFRNDNHIRTLPWPELSPDLSPIEHLWDELLEDASVDELFPLNLLISFKGHSQMSGTTFHGHLPCV
jgi:transposase